MKSPLQRILKPVKHPEFTVPGSLSLMVGIALGIATWKFDVFREAGPLSTLLISTGICLLHRTVWGTGLMAFTLAILVYKGSWKLGISSREIASLVCSLVFLGSMVACMIEQIAWHSLRRKPRPSQTAARSADTPV